MRRNGVEAQGFCICLLKTNADVRNLKSYGPKTFLFQREGNFASMYRNLQKFTGEILEACSCISFFLVFSMFRKYPPPQDSFCQDVYYKLYSLKQQPNQYINLEDKILYIKSFLEHREPVQLPTSRKLRPSCTPSHAPCILLGKRQ